MTKINIPAAVHEASMAAVGAVKYRQRQLAAREKGRETSTPSGQQLLRTLLPDFTVAIKRATDLRRRTGSAGKRSTALPYVRIVAPEKAALITLRTVLDGITASKRLTATAATVGRRMEDEVRMCAAKKQNSKAYRWLMDRVKQSSDYRYQRRVMVHGLNLNETVDDWDAWGTAMNVKVGMFLIDLMATSTGVLLRERDKRHEILMPTPDLVAALGQLDETLAAATPWYLPTLDEPKDWTSPVDGGYRAYPLPIMPRADRDYLKELGECTMPLVYGALNKAQATPWRVNKDVLEVFSTLWHADEACPVLPSRDSEEMPLRPVDLPPVGSKLTETEKEILKAYKRRRSTAIAKEQRRGSHIMADAQLLNVARTVRDAERFYFPHRLDFRGRMYSIPLWLSPQGNDASRGMLEFAEGKQPGHGTPASRWFLIHGANCWGEDKLSLADRVAWAYSNAEMICEVAADPLSNRQWMQADKPWQFLAWAFEFAQWNSDEEFSSHIPVSMDGSANGLQHFSAMLRDPRGAHATNLTNTEEPCDIYQEVVDEVIERVKLDASSEGDWYDLPSLSTPAPCVVGPAKRALTAPIARQWLASGLLDRTCVKRQVMTKPYGAVAHGMQTQLIKHLEKLEDSGPLDLENTWEASRYLTPIICDSIDTVVVAAAEAMAWLRAVGKAYGKAGEPIRWQTPAGMLVEQHYQSTTMTRVNTQLMGSLKLRLRVEDGGTDSRKMANGLSPNFVHSLDAAHLHLTMGKLEGLSWAVVHDSYGCHAADAPALAEALRLAFVQMYDQHLPLWELAIHAGGALGDVPMPPEQSTFDITEVLDADYFFA